MERKGNTNLIHPAKQQGGFALMAFLLAFVIFAIIVGVLVATFTSLGSSNDNQTALRGVISMRGTVQQLYSHRSYNNGADYVAAIIASQKVPAGFRHSNAGGGAGGSITDPWGGDVTIDGDGTDFTITIAEVPQSGCMYLLGETVSDRANWQEVGTDTQNTVTTGDTYTDACTDGDNKMMFTSN